MISSPNESEDQLSTDLCNQPTHVVKICSGRVAYVQCKLVTKKSMVLLYVGQDAGFSLHEYVQAAVISECCQIYDGSSVFNQYRFTSYP